MRSIALAAVTAGVLATAGLAQADTWDRSSDSRASAYVGMEFGGATTTNRDVPLRYGFRFDQARSHRWQADTFGGTPFAMANFTAKGLEQISFNGVPMVRRAAIPGNRANGDDTEYQWTDWALIAVAAAGFGYLIYEISEGDDDDEPEPAEDTGGGLLGGDGGGLLGGGDDGDDGDGGGLLGGLLGGEYRGGGYVRGLGERVDPEYQRWLDGGSGQMGDLGG